MELPERISKIACEIEEGGMEATAKIDLGPVKESLDLTPINKPLDELCRIKGLLASQIKSANAGVQKLQEFVGSAPKQIEQAFDIAPCVPKVMPLARQKLLKNVGGLAALDLSP